MVRIISVFPTYITYQLMYIKYICTPHTWFS